MGLVPSLETPKSTFSLSMHQCTQERPWSPQGEDGVHKPGRRLSPETKLTGTFTLDVPASRTVGNKFVV